MAILSIEYLDELGARFEKSAGLAQLTESLQGQKFDVFLCHSSKDVNVIWGIYRELKRIGLLAYVDWIHDSELDRSTVTAENAQTIRTRLRQSSCLFYVRTRNSERSQWMQWEVGYMDGRKPGKVAVLLLQDREGQQYGKEYLDLYPYIDKVNDSLFVNYPGGGYDGYEEWLRK
jgi:hypothetical protein